MMGDYETHVHRRFDGSELVHTHYVATGNRGHTHDYLQVDEASREIQRDHLAARDAMDRRYEMALRGVIPPDIEKRMIDEYRTIADTFKDELILDMLDRRYKGPLDPNQRIARDALLMTLGERYPG